MFLFTCHYSFDSNLSNNNSRILYISRLLKFNLIFYPDFLEDIFLSTLWQYSVCLNPIKRIIRDSNTDI